MPSNVSLSPSLGPRVNSAKDLARWATRCFASLSMTVPRHCSPYINSLLGLFPVHGSLDCSLPTSIELIALIGAHLRLKCAVNGPVLCQLMLAAPEANRKAGQVGSAQGCRLRNLWSLHRHAENIGLELHEQVVYDSTAIDTQGFHVNLTISRHGFEHVTSLITHRLEDGTSDIASI